MNRRALFAKSALAVGAVAIPGVLRADGEPETAEPDVLRLRPDDLLVFTVPQKLNAEQFEELADAVYETLWENGIERQRAMILTGGATVQVLRREDLP